MEATVPPRASSLWAVMPAATAARKAELARLQADARKQAQHRRERVLKHEWAKQRLRKIFGYKAAEQWNGYMPPARDPARNGGDQSSPPNTSEHRKALMQLLRDVDEFDRTGQLPEGVTDLVEVDPSESK
ncbi:hypothetical protein [Actinoplanes subtropicus]|uniref:hypothetical protein n=1 Tax=Actinoplanes subtropicus TaxID=543632 RepID=UPI0004C2C8E4|nr:hypothetical protein [Actinoplanes subtropicus]